MRNNHKLEENKTRAIKRGLQGERTVRPNNERFLNTKNFELQFRAFLDAEKHGKKVEECGWGMNLLK